MRSAAGLQVDAFYFEQAHFAGPLRWSYRHRTDEFGLCFEFLVRDPTATDRMIGGNECPKIGSDPFFVNGVFHIEIESTFCGLNITARDAVLDYRAEQMHRSVHPHVEVAAIPVDCGPDRCVDRRQFQAFPDEVSD